jgi:hypothetical protein
MEEEVALLVLQIHCRRGRRWQLLDFAIQALNKVTNLLDTPPLLLQWRSVIVMRTFA